MSEETDNRIRCRILDLASALRAESWPDLDGDRAVKIAMRFVVLILEIERLRVALEIDGPRVVH